MDNKELLEYLIGPGSVAKLVGALFYALLGAFLLLLMSTTKRDPASARTPYHFSWNFLFSDNAKRVAAAVILIFIFVRFSRELLGADITMYAAVLIGLSADRLGNIISKNVLKPKE